jgi:hypothetical protein
MVRFYEPLAYWSVFLRKADVAYLATQSVVLLSGSGCSRISFYAAVKPIASHFDQRDIGWKVIAIRRRSLHAHIETPAKCKSPITLHRSL